MLELLTNGAGFGFTAGTTIGPLHTLLMNVTLAKGWRQGVWIALSPLMTDIPIVILMLVILGQLPPVGIEIIRIIGGLVVLLLAWRGWQAYRRGVSLPTSQESPAQGETRQTILKGMVVNLTNPGPYIFWGTIMGPTMIRALETSALHAAAFVAGFYVTFIGIMLIFLVVFDRARTLPPHAVRLLSLLSVIVLVILGLSLINAGVQGLSTAA